VRFSSARTCCSNAGGTRCGGQHSFRTAACAVFHTAERLLLAPKQLIAYSTRPDLADVEKIKKPALRTKFAAALAEIAADPKCGVDDDPPDPPRAAEEEEGWLSAGHFYIGQRVAKAFELGKGKAPKIVIGTVTKWLPASVRRSAPQRAVARALASLCARGPSCFAQCRSLEVERWSDPRGLAARGGVRRTPSLARRSRRSSTSPTTTATRRTSRSTKYKRYDFLIPPLPASTTNRPPTRHQQATNRLPTGHHQHATRARAARERWTRATGAGGRARACVAAGSVQRAVLVRYS
jgi:hypothetical protein